MQVLLQLRSVARWLAERLFACGGRLRGLRLGQQRPSELGVDDRCDQGGKKSSFHGENLRGPDGEQAVPLVY